MAVTAVNEVIENRTASRSGQRISATRVYDVETDSASTSEWDVVNAASLPALYSAHPDNTYLRAFNFTSKQRVSGRDAALFWTVEVQYVGINELAANGSEVGGGTIEDPWDLPWNVQIGSGGSYADPCQMAYDVATTQLPNWPTVGTFSGLTQGEPGVAVQNSAGNPYDPLPNYIHSSLFRFSKAYQEADWDATVIEDYKDTVNADQVVLVGFTAPKLTLWMRDISASLRVTASGDNYWEVTYDIEYKPHRHYLSIMDMRPKDRVKLDGSGGVQDTSGSPMPEPYMRHFLFKYPTNWSGLNLPIEVQPASTP